MIHDVKPEVRQIIASSDYFKTFIELRSGIITDHIVDTLARSYALEIRLGEGYSLYSSPDRQVIKDVTRVTYG